MQLACRVEGGQKLVVIPGDSEVRRLSIRSIVLGASLATVPGSVALAVQVGFQ